MELSCLLFVLLSFVTGPHASVLADDPFPVPSDGVSIPAPQEGGPTLLTVLGDFSRVTGQHLHVSEHTLGRLRETPIGLIRGVEIPPGEIYSFVEGLLWQSGFALIDDRDAAPRMLAIKSVRGDGRQHSPGDVLEGCRTVPAAALGAYKRHPALMIQTVVAMPNADGRDLAKVLRMLVTDNTTQQIAVVGDSVILRGPGRQVAHMAEMLESIDALGLAPQRRGEAREDVPEEESEDGK